jgi:hypothetical protein
LRVRARRVARGEQERVVMAVVAVMATTLLRGVKTG